VVDPAGVLTLRTGEFCFRGTLLGGVSEIEIGQQLRIRVELDHLAGEPPSLDLTMTLIGRVASPHGSVVETPRIELIQDTCFIIEVLQFSRGLLWAEPDACHPTAGPSVAFEESPTLELPQLPPQPEAPSSGADAGHELETITVRLDDAEGAVSLEVDGRFSPGRLLRLPDVVLPGTDLHLRVATTGVDGESMEQSDLLGRVVSVDDSVPGPAASFRAGLRLELAAVRYSGNRCPFPLVDEERLDALIGAEVWDTAITELSPLPDLLPPPPEEEPTPVSPFDLPLLSDEEPPSLEPSGIIGSLRQMPLVDLLQSLEMNGKTCRVDVPSSELQEGGALYLRSGQLIAAFMGDQSGEAAFYTLVQVEHGTFRVHFDREAPEQNIHRSTTYLLLESMRMRDEGLGLAAAPVGEEASGFDAALDAAIDETLVDALDAVADRATGEVAAPTLATLEEITQPEQPAVAAPPKPVFSAFFEEARRAERRPPAQGSIFGAAPRPIAAPAFSLDELEEALESDGGLDLSQLGWIESSSIPPSAN